MLAAIPSVVYGLWGIFFLAPLLRTYVEPFLGTHFGWFFLFEGAPYGIGMLAAALILAVMVTPTITAICREVFRAVPETQREAALGLGATKWEMIRLAVVKSSWSGVFGAGILGLGRALGETMAVTMLIGNRNEISSSLFAPGQTMASVIANEYAEAGSNMHLAALAYVGLALFLVSFAVNLVARRIVKRLQFTGDAK
jgi:phosphate transport system permease protein